MEKMLREEVIDEINLAIKEMIELNMVHSDDDMLENLTVTVDGVKYSTGWGEMELDDDCVGEKYENGIMVHQVCSVVGDIGMRTDIFYAAPFSRSGSYYSDYHYEYDVPYQVEKQTRTYTVEEWVPVCKK